MLLVQAVFLPQHIQRSTQQRTRMRLDPLHASLAPEFTRLPPFPGRPFVGVEAQQPLGGTTANGGLRRLAIMAPIRGSKLRKLPVRHVAFPTPLSSSACVRLPRTQTRLLTLIGQGQRVDQPTQQ